MIDWTQVALAGLAILSAVLTALLKLAHGRIVRADKQLDERDAEVKRLNEARFTEERERGDIATRNTERVLTLAQAQATAAKTLTGGRR